MDLNQFISDNLVWIISVIGSIAIAFYKINEQRKIHENDIKDLNTKMEKVDKDVEKRFEIAERIIKDTEIATKKRDTEMEGVYRDMKSINERLDRNAKSLERFGDDLTNMKTGIVEIKAILNTMVSPPRQRIDTMEDGYYPR